MLSEYFQQALPGQSPINRVFLLWASAKVPGILKPEQQKAIIDDVLSKQQADGGWSTASIVMSTWKLRDNTPLDTRSDGYGTGLVTFVLE